MTEVLHNIFLEELGQPGTGSGLDFSDKFQK